MFVARADPGPVGELILKVSLSAVVLLMQTGANMALIPGHRWSVCYSDQHLVSLSLLKQNIAIPFIQLVIWYRL